MRWSRVSCWCLPLTLSIRSHPLHPVHPNPPPSAFQLGSANGDHQQEKRVVGRQGSQLGHTLLQPVLMSHRAQLQLLCGLSYFLWAWTPSPPPTPAPLGWGVQ